ncbi:hypothetical protein ACFLZN_01500 [Nanoarchaeota archaeon]
MKKRTKAIIGLILNLLEPGLGSLIHKLWLNGILQILMVFSGFLMIGITLFSGPLVGEKLSFLFYIGSILFVGGYVWSFIDGIRFIRDSKE